MKRLSTFNPSTSDGNFFIVVFLLLQFCTYGQLLELKLLAFLSGTLHIILLFLHAVQINDGDDDESDIVMM